MLRLMKLPMRILALMLLLLPEVAQAEWAVQWSRELPARKSAWQHTQRMIRDTGYVPVIAGDLVLTGCEHNGAVAAYDLKTGVESWRFFSGAPIRSAPVADGQRVFVGSSDGYLYCLDQKGQLVWKHRGGPADRWVIGHDRLISCWPVATRPVVADGIVYFAAGYWPVDRIFVHALDAATGKVLWTTSAPQLRPSGEMRIVDGKLMIDGDNSNAVLDPASGRVLSDKHLRPPAPERPNVAVKGTITGWQQSGEAVAVGTTEGLFVFGQYATPAPREHKLVPPQPAGESGDASRVFAAVIDRGTSSYCLVAGLKDGTLVEGLLRNSKLHVVAVDSDAAKIEHIRRDLDARGLFNEHRLSVLCAEPPALPPYFASLIVSETSNELAQASRECLRPYGGALVLKENGVLKIIRREGALAKSADWTHEYFDAANSLASGDELVKAPLGVLWYGGVAADARFYFDGLVDHQSGHGLSPQPVPAQVVEGRMFLQGPGLLGAFDIYTGAMLWETELPKVYVFGGAGGGLGIHSKKHPEPWRYEEAMKSEVTPPQRCRASGFDFVSQPDGIYVAAGPILLRFNPTDGKLLSKWPVPIDGDLCWGNLRVCDELLIATLFRPQDMIDAQAGFDGNGGDWAGDRMPMSHLAAVNRHSGKLVWSRKAHWGWTNRSGIAAGGGKVFCTDAITAEIHAKWKEAGRSFSSIPPALYALDLGSGRELWHFPLDVFVNCIAWSSERDLLLVPCRHLKEWDGTQWVERLIDPKKSGKNALGRMRALKASNGSVAWDVSEAPYHTPHILLDDLIIDRYGFTYDLTSGKRHAKTSPLTGRAQSWSFEKSGCNYLIACRSLVTWRTGFYDLHNHSGIMKLTGMDAGCSPTLLPAGGVLNIPNFGTHHKRNRMTAMVLIHRPDNALWTVYEYTKEKSDKQAAPLPLQRVGFNFGAPGDHFAADGVLWLDVAAKGSDVLIEPADAHFLQRDSGGADAWLAGSAVIGASKIVLPSATDGARLVRPRSGSFQYTVKLCFAELEAIGPGERVFSVSLEGQKVLTDFDIVQAAGGPRRLIVREFKSVKVDGPLEIDVVPKLGRSLICGVEIKAE